MDLCDPGAKVAGTSVAAAALVTNNVYSRRRTMRATGKEPAKPCYRKAGMASARN